ncbi:hypothetical protein BU26DRAFT_560048 [Trematosphaeria pertusa]|uniref:Uncharacterized protein n=1 Tax=Trematosphaeria pertusa TaxID=390896 RepID=A0A6A6IYN2_9PLEO|nr:uncharacterized protein BU26DRAFT_560048 [Trematosphaeria pertusa]KAF2255446.1 hypothetical protein BU26DRAFT_560048 [Trematosphaeria pertusa]
MQFSVVSIVAALAAVSSASYLPSNGTAIYPTGTAAPTGSMSPTPSNTIPFTGAAPVATGAGSAMALLVAAGGAALMI